MVLNTNYRIARHDKRNLVIQRYVSDKTGWVTISYHGNSLNSLISGLYDLIMSQHTPGDEKLLAQLEKVRLELVSGKEEIRKMVEGYYE